MEITEEILQKVSMQINVANDMEMLDIDTVMKIVDKFEEFYHQGVKSQTLDGLYNDMQKNLYEYITSNDNRALTFCCYYIILNSIEILGLESRQVRFMDSKALVAG